MKAKNLNASSVKTRNLIRDTFAELLYEKKNINKIKRGKRKNVKNRK